MRLLGLRSTCTVALRWVTCKREAPRSDGDTGGVSAMGTPMLKSVKALMSRRHVSMVWCQGTLGWAAADTNERSPIRSRRRKSGATASHVRGTACMGMTFWVSSVAPGYYLTRVNSIRFRRKDTILPPLCDRFTLRDGILWSEQITPSTSTF
ncbi:hypothetical protein TIFTF001_003491 [Ficus carica]|uniref:Uncharacterized protein n=1 Tax=Ficus carica TaxID=3494 RepID=A0AA88DAL5_FICCA|nr:hypothetical protein TIFTF001_003491 [Ficus carica]